MTPRKHRPNKPNRPAPKTKKKGDDFVAPLTQNQNQNQGGQGPTAPPPAAGGGTVGGVV